MGDWQDRLVFYRDFGYSKSRRRILSTYAMAHDGRGNIGDTSAHTFAEYVVTVHDPRHQRPSLLFRIYPNRLRMQANAKSLCERLLSGPLVDVYIGESKKHWTLHRDLLFYHSGALQGALQPDGTLSKTKVKPAGSSENVRLELPDVDSSGFELFVKWMYQGKLDDVSEITDPQDKYTFAVACYNLHQLCNRFDIPKLKNIAIDQYRKGLAEAELVPDAEEINDIYRKSPEGSPFRTLMTKIAARQIMDPNGEKDAEGYRLCFHNNPDFAIDLVNAIKHGTGGILFDDPTEGEGCEYHDHDNGPNCHKKAKARLGVSQSTEETIAGSTLFTATKPLAPIPSPPPTPIPHPRRSTSPQQTNVKSISGNRLESEQQYTMASDSFELGEAGSGTKHGILEISRSKSTESGAEVGAGTIEALGTGSPTSPTGRRSAPKLRRKTPEKEEK